MEAYSGMRAGCSMESSMSRRSLITGKVRMEESRKEMRNSPGAPRVPAKRTIFCFQPDRDADKLGSLRGRDSVAEEVWGVGWGGGMFEVICEEGLEEGLD